MGCDISGRRSLYTCRVGVYRPDDVDLVYLSYFANASVWTDNRRDTLSTAIDRAHNLDRAKDVVKMLRSSCYIQKQWLPNRTPDQQKQTENIIALQHPDPVDIA
jgi:hypothetical protein